MVMTGLLELAPVEGGVLRFSHTDGVGGLDEVVAQVKIALASERDVFIVECTRVVLVHTQPGELGKGVVVTEALDVADLGQDASRVYRPDSRDGMHGVGEGLRLAGDQPVELLELLLEEADGI